MLADILLVVDCRDQAALILLDLSAAFNTVNHEILPHRLWSVTVRAKWVFMFTCYRPHLRHYTEISIPVQFGSFCTLLTYCPDQVTVCHHIYMPTTRHVVLLMSMSSQRN